MGRVEQKIFGKSHLKKQHKFSKAKFLSLPSLLSGDGISFKDFVYSAHLQLAYGLELDIREDVLNKFINYFLLTTIHYLTRIQANSLP